MEISSNSIFGNSLGKNRNLYPHQVSAVQWEKTIEYNISNPQFFKGGIFADEMGMGKTLVTCVLVATTPVPYTLIMCPPLIRFVWVEELLKTVSSDVNVYTIDEGNILKCKIVIDEDGVEHRVNTKINYAKGDRFVRPAVVVCNYQLIATGVKNNIPITDIYWHRIILDEAHILRNENDSWEKIFSLKQPYINTNGVSHRYGSRWCITGTPIQMGGNRDLINIFKFIDSRFLTSRNQRELNLELTSLIATNLFRRNKNQLTPYMKRYMNFPDTEPIFYKERIDLENTGLSRLIETMDYRALFNYCRTGNVFNQNRINEILADEKAFIMTKILEFKYENHGVENQKFYESQNFREFISYPYNKFPNLLSSTRYGYTGRRSKIERFKVIVDRFRDQPNNSFVVFHHFKKIGEQLKETIRRDYPTYIVLEINGDLKDKQKDDIRILANQSIDEGKTVILLSSIKATYEGINYQAFNKIIFIDSEYNVKVEEQARSRVQRIGQMNQVLIFEIIINDFNISRNEVISVDNRIQEIRDEKIHLSNIIDEYNAAFPFKRIYFRDDEGNLTSGVDFGPEFENLPMGTIGGPNSFGPDWPILDDINT